MFLEHLLISKVVSNYLLPPSQTQFLFSTNDFERQVSYKVYTLWYHGFLIVRKFLFAEFKYRKTSNKHLGTYSIFEPQKEVTIQAECLLEWGGYLIFPDV